MKKLYLLNEVAKVLRKRPYQVAYAITSGSVKEPKLRISNKRIFLEEDIRRLAVHFGIDPEAKEEQCKNS